MVDFFGEVGTRVKVDTGYPNVPRGQVKATPMYFWRDRYELVTAVAQGSRIFAGKVPSTARLDRNQSVVRFDDLGTSITLDMGCDDTHADIAPVVSSSSTKLVTSLDVATAAGNSTLLENIDIANDGKMLWELLGLTADPGVDIELWFTVGGGDPGTGSLTWQIVGTPG